MTLQWRELPILFNKTYGAVQGPFSFVVVHDRGEYSATYKVNNGKLQIIGNEFTSKDEAQRACETILEQRLCQ